MTACMAIMLALAGWAADDQINLADFGRVVEYSGDAPAILASRELQRGPDGWTAWKGPDGQYMIGLEWDQPRDVAVAEIEFRHAIADRDKVKVQYFHDAQKAGSTDRQPAVTDSAHGEWRAVQGEWWAGDRDIGYAFARDGGQQADENVGSDARSRRTRRLRFLLGHRNENLPPVRYIRVYGPARPDERAFDIQLEPSSILKAPLEATVANGLIIEEKTTTRAATLEGDPVSLRVRYAEDDTTSPNRTVVTLRPEGKAVQGVSFLPAEAVQKGTIRLSAMGVTIRRVGGPPATKPANGRERPAKPASSAPEES